MPPADAATHPTSGARLFIRRLVGAAALNPALYEEVEADHTATGQAAGCLLLASVAAGVGARGFGGNSSADIVVDAAVALVMWVAWAVLIGQVGTRFLPGSRTRTDVGELLRTLGFSAAPGIVLAAAAIPGCAVPAAIAVGVWLLASMIVAVRQALDYSSTGRAVAVCATAAALVLACAIGIGLFLAPRVS